MKSRRIWAWLLMAIGTAGAAAAQNPFVGTWKLNQEKSALAGDTMKFNPAAGESYELVAGGTAYSFRINGNNYRMADGDLAVWKQIDASTWTTDYRKADGKPLATDTWKLSADYKTLTVITTGTNPDGKSFRDTAVYLRTAGTTGLLGAWKSTEVKLSTPHELVIAAYGLDGLSIKITALKASLLAAFDGKDVVPIGPNIPPGLTLSLFRIGPSSFRLVQKINGHAAYSSRFTVSADGQTMTEIGNAVGDPSQTGIWEKQ